jgi:hypothetical protein
VYLKKNGFRSDGSHHHRHHHYDHYDDDDHHRHVGKRNRVSHHAPIAALVRADHAIVALVRVGIECHVGPHIDLLAILLLDLRDHLGHHAVGVVALVGCVGLELLGNLGEEDDVLDALGDCLANLLHDRGAGVPLAPRHRGDGLVGVEGVEEEGVDKVRGLDLVLADLAADTLVLAVAPRASTLRNPHIALLVDAKAKVGVAGRGACKRARAVRVCQEREHDQTERTAKVPPTPQATQEGRKPKSFVCTELLHILGTVTEGGIRTGVGRGHGDGRKSRAG